MHAAAVATFGLATIAAFAAENSDRPRTATVVYVLGVTLVGALEGLRGGLIAAFAASLIYNFFLSAPTFQFSLTSAEELVPLIVFNLSAAASGLLAGWLKDRALAAERASRRMRALFEVSKKLQGAVHVDEIPGAIAGYLGDENEEPEIYFAAGEMLKSAGDKTRHAALAQSLLQDGGSVLHEPDCSAFLLAMPSGRSGALILSTDGRLARSEDHDLDAFVSLLSLTLERCLLLEQVSEAELIRRSEQYKTALLSSVSHDLRTPLSAIAASASSLARFGVELSESSRNDLLATIGEQCDRLDRYTTNLLNLGRLQGGLDRTRFVECDVIEALGIAIGHARGLGSGHAIEKAYEIAAATVHADPVMLEQIFYNVLENAVRYSPADAPIDVGVVRAGDKVLVSISDGGGGIADQDVAHVFERFYRGGSLQGEKGSGLGLSIAKGFVEAFGGTIQVQRASNSGNGTTIAISLPQMPSGDQVT